MEFRKYKWLLFDFDNTLVDFNKASELSFKEMIERLGLSYSKDLYKSYKIENNKVWSQYEKGKIDSIRLRSLRFEYFFEKMSIDMDPMWGHKQYISGLVKHTEGEEKVLTILKNLKKNHKLSIITNGLKEAQRPRLANSGIDKLVDSIVISDEIGVAKPDTGFFDYTMNEIKHKKKSELLIIGDSLLSDILGGVQSGIDTVWYNPAGNELHSGVKPTYEIKDLNELIY